MADYGIYLKEVALSLLGEPSTKKNDQWRYGNNGSLSIDLKESRFYDHESESGGGVLDLIMRETNALTVKAAINWLETNNFKPADEPSKPKVKSKIVKTYDYITEAGEILYQVVRMEPKSFRQRKPEGSGWNWSVKGVTPLPYRLPELLENENATILIVEGERDVDALRDLGLIATCNSGGAGKFNNALVPFFKGRKIVLIPDSDEAGEKHAQLVAGKLYEVADSIRVIKLDGLSEKQDVSDWLAAGGDKAKLIALAKAAKPWAPVKTSEPIKAVKISQSRDDGKPFKSLGYNGTSYYYLPRGTEQVAEIKRGSHTSPAELMSIAPLEWWEVTYPKATSGVDWQAAGNDCMRNCERRGIYSHDRERGRGAWYDKGRAVLHLGNKMLVDSVETSIADHESTYIYTKQAPLEYGASAIAATNEEGASVGRLFYGLNWSKSVHAQLLSGWCALAPICGAMSWRPHLWITAQRGAGKSWVQDHIIGPLIGPAALMVQGSTTEAGIRQKLKQDARPIVFDEAESEDSRSQSRMQTVIELARQSSSDSSAEIIKGTVAGNGMSFRMRSMFLLGSVNVSLSQAADESRFSVLSLLPPEKTPEEIDRFEKYAASVDSLLTKELCAKIRARSYELMPIIRDNCATFSRAVAEVLGSQRLGDQIGTLISGSYSLYFNDLISLADARDWVSNIDFSDAKEAEQVSDEESCLNRILQSHVRFDSDAGQLTRSLGELVDCACKREQMSGMTSINANDVLCRYGLKVDEGRLSVANKNAELSKLLKDSPWASSWKRILGRINGAHESFNPVRFAGTRSRCIRIPMEYLG